MKNSVRYSIFVVLAIGSFFIKEPYGTYVAFIGLIFILVTSPILNLISSK